MENTLVKPKEAEVLACNLPNLAKSGAGGSDVDKEKFVEWINCDANIPGFEHLTGEQIIGRLSENVLEESEEEEDMTKKQISHNTTLTSIKGLFQYLKEQEGTSLYDKMVLKKLQRSSEENVFYLETITAADYFVQK